MALLHYAFLLIVAISASLQIEVPQDTCNAVGAQCSSDCKNLVFCPAVGDTPIVIIPCFEQDGRFCQQTSNATYDCAGVMCSRPDPVPNFLCTGVGIYPSAYSCQKFYVCTGSNGYPGLECTCTEDDEMYDIVSRDCIVAECLRKAADCPGGLSGVLGDGFCYICDNEYFAVVYRCPGVSLSALLAPRPKKMACKPYQVQPPKGS